MNKRSTVLVLAVLSTLGGCTSSPQQREADEAAAVFDTLYDGKSRAAYSTEMPASSALEAVAKGDHAAATGDLDQALFQYIRALKKDPKRVDALSRIGSIHLERGNLVLAARGFGLALQTAPEHATSLEGLGIVQLQRREYESAKSLLTRAVDAAPGLWRAHNGLGVIADLEERYEAAQGHYLAALERRPKLPRLLNNLGYSYYLAGNWNMAVATFRRAVALAPDYERAWRNLGLVHARRGDYMAAVDAFRRVEEEAAAYNNVGYLCLTDRRYREAERFLRKAVDLSPTWYETAHRNLRRARGELGAI